MRTMSGYGRVVLSLLLSLSVKTVGVRAQVSADSLVTLLDSPVWQDRANGLFGLGSLPDSALPASFGPRVLALLDQEAVSPLAVDDTLGEGYGSYRVGLVRQALRLADPAAIRGLAYLGVQVNEESQVFLAEQGSAAIGPLDEAWTNRPAARTGIMGTWGYLVGSYQAGISSTERTYLLSRLVAGAESEPLGFMDAVDKAPLPAAVPMIEEIAASGAFSITVSLVLPDLESLRGQLSPEDLQGQVLDLVNAMCLDADGAKATLCGQLLPLMQADPSDVQALNDLKSLADSALAAGTLSAYEDALVAGNAEVLIEEAGSGGSLTLPVTADTYLRRGAPNRNQGTEEILRIRSSGNNRALVAVDAAALSAVSAPVTQAYLEFDIVFNANNWGNDGRTVDAHRMLVPWTHYGATWSCADDLDPGNQSPDCPSTEWEMRTLDPSPYEPTPSGTLLVTGDLTGTVTIDVTSDVNAMLAGQVPSYGWILRKTEEGQNGRIEIASSETGEGPRLVLVP